MLLSLLRTITGAAILSGASVEAGGPFSSHSRRQLPADPTGVQTIVTSSNVTIRYKEPGKAGICETTPGVNSYSGYVDLAPDAHTFFWFFESRNDSKNDPITLWLNGGPGSDSLIGMFQELGPCNVTKDNVTQLNPYSWNEYSNMLFISQPLGTGFSYGSEGEGSLNNITGTFQNASIGGVDGRYPVINATALDTTDLAAIATWHVLQGFLGGLPQLDANIQSKEFNLWTESYGGHYGPAFFNYFYEQNQMIANGTQQGIQLNMNSLGIGNGIIDELIQAPMYPEFAVNNTYGIKAYNDTVYSYAKFAYYMINGCKDQVELCRSTNYTTLAEQSICTEAADMCRDNVEGVYYSYGGRGVYDIRHPYDDPTPPSYFINLLNNASTQDALGVNLNYTQFSNNDIYYAFQQTGDFVYGTFIDDLETLLSAGVRVALYYGDADYICNWFGGEAVSLAVKYTHSDQFRSAGYTPFTLNGTEYGETRQAGNFSFTRVYEAGHEVPYYQPEASLELFRRSIQGYNVADGSVPVDATYQSNGTANATHTESFVPLPSSTTSSADVTTSSGTVTATALPAVFGREYGGSSGAEIRGRYAAMMI